MDFIKTCESVFNEIQQMRKELEAGKISPESYAMQMGGVSQLEKQQKLMLAGTVAESSLKRKIAVELNEGISGIKTASKQLPKNRDERGRYIT